MTDKTSLAHLSKADIERILTGRIAALTAELKAAREELAELRRRIDPVVLSAFETGVALAKSRGGGRT